LPSKTSSEVHDAESSRLYDSASSLYIYMSSSDKLKMNFKWEIRSGILKYLSQIAKQSLQKFCTC